MNLVDLNQDFIKLYFTIRQIPVRCFLATQRYNLLIPFFTWNNTFFTSNNGILNSTTRIYFFAIFNQKKKKKKLEKWLYKETTYTFYYDTLKPKFKENFFLKS